MSDRVTCPKCAIKHLSRAKVFVSESKLGYPHHIWDAMGEMSHAEDELVVQMPEEANMVREERLKLEADHSYVVPWNKLRYMIAEAAVLPEVLDDCGNIRKRSTENE
jgi:hypothetical protein